VPNGSKNLRKSRRGERSEHADLSRIFSVNVVLKFSQLSIKLNFMTLIELEEFYHVCIDDIKI
jgi:hypothetical protein